jgi:hypothetical protein
VELSFAGYADGEILRRQLFFRVLTQNFSDVVCRGDYEVVGENRMGNFMAEDAHGDFICAEMNRFCLRVEKSWSVRVPGANLGKRLSAMTVGPIFSANRG